MDNQAFDDDELKQNIHYNNTTTTTTTVQQQKQCNDTTTKSLTSITDNNNHCDDDDDKNDTTKVIPSLPSSTNIPKSTLKPTPLAPAPIPIEPVLRSLTTAAATTTTTTRATTTSNSPLAMLKEHYFSFKNLSENTSINSMTDVDDNAIGVGVGIGDDDCCTNVPNNNMVIHIDRNIFYSKDFTKINLNLRSSGGGGRKYKNNDDDHHQYQTSSKWLKMKQQAKRLIGLGSNDGGGGSGGDGGGDHWSLNEQLDNKMSKDYHHHHHHHHCSPLLTLLYTIFPILKWLKEYSIKDDLVYDIIAGCTLHALHIPQGLAYGRLAGLEPINGLYVSLFPSVIYAIFGGSKQISIGSFAVISIACKSVLDGFEYDPHQIEHKSDDWITTNQTTAMIGQQQQIPPPITPIEILSSLCLLIGVIQFFLGLLHLGILATLLSDPIISAFCVAASTHVFTSQIFGLFGINNVKLPDEPNFPFEIVRSWYRLLSQIKQTNMATLLISFLTMMVLISCKNLLEPYLCRRFKLKSIAIPIDILVIISLTGISYFADLSHQYHVAMIPNISAGFQGMPVMPRIDLWPRLLTSGILIAFIVYAGTFSLQKMYANKHGYEVYPNQELFAIGTANIVSSFFLCYPAAGSLGRSAVQDKVARTQLASLISAVLIVIFILFLSRFLETLPRCALSSIILVALYSTFCKHAEVIHFWRISKLDGLLWIATYALVVFIGVDRGLLFALIIGLALLIFRLAIPQFNLKHRIAQTECYIGVLSSSLSSSSLSHNQESVTSQNNNHNDNNNNVTNHHHYHHQTTTTPSSKPVPGVIIFEFHGPLLFINVEQFKTQFQKQLLTRIKVQQRRYQLKRNLIVHNIPLYDTNVAKIIMAINENQDHHHHHRETSTATLVHTVVFDCARVCLLDGKAVTVLLEMECQLKSLQKPVKFLLANCSDIILQTMTKCKFFEKFPKKNCFLTVHDAVCSVVQLNDDDQNDHQDNDDATTTNDANGGNGSDDGSEWRINK